MRKKRMKELGRLSVKEFKKGKKVPIVIILDNVRSAYNVGAVFRTADAFALQEIYLCGITAQPPHKEIMKTALGATESVDWKYYESTVSIIKKLKQEHYTILSVEQTKESIQLNEFQPTKESKLAFVFGNEVKGVGEEVLSLSDACLEIPQYGTKHSLNIAVSMGIVIWDCIAKIRKSNFI